MLLLEPVGQALQMWSSIGAQLFDGRVGDGKIDAVALQCLQEVMVQRGQGRFFSPGCALLHQLAPVMFFEQFLETTMHQVAANGCRGLRRRSQAIQQIFPWTVIGMVQVGNVEDSITSHNSYPILPSSTPM